MAQSQKTNQTARVLELLKRFNNGEKVCITSLQNDPLWYKKCEKTIRRDLDVLKEYFPDSFELIRGGKGEKGSYRAITKSTFDNFLKPDSLSLLIQTFNIAQRSDLFDNFEMGDDEKRILKDKIKHVNKHYTFKNKPFETKRDDHVLLQKLENAIEKQEHIILKYPIKGKDENIEVQPYKIIFIQENFYLACGVEHVDYEFSIYRISKIKNIDTTTKTYQKDYEIEDFINHIQTPFPIFKRPFRKNLINVKLHVNQKKAYFFKAKKFFSSQSIKENDDGSLEVSYKVTQEMELESFIKSWIPYVRVTAPLSLKEKIEEELREYVEL